MSILVVTTEPLPLPGKSTTGAGLRAWGLAAGLAARMGDVVIAMPNTVGGGSADPVEVYPGGPRLRVKAFPRAALTEFVRERDPSVVVMQHWGLMKELHSCACPLAIDLAGPHLLERLYWKSPDPNADLLEKIDALGRADFAVCSGAYQRHYFLPYLQMAGWDVTAPDLCPVIPFSFSPRLPEPPENRDMEAFVFGGVFLPWQNSEAALRAALEAMDETGKGRLHFHGGPHPEIDVSHGQFDQLWRDLETHGRVTTHGFAPFDELLKVYSTYSVALDLMARNPERELAFTTRTVVYMACGLPVIHNNYSELSVPIEKRRLGWTIDPRDRDGLKMLIRRLLECPEEVWDRGESARDWVSSELNWEQTIEPLAAFCAAPRLRRDKQAARLAWESQPRRIAELERELASVTSAFDTLRGKWLFRLYERRARWSWLLIPLAAPFVALGALAVWAGMMLTRARVKQHHGRPGLTGLTGHGADERKPG